MIRLQAQYHTHNFIFIFHILGKEESEICCFVLETSYESIF